MYIRGTNCVPSIAKAPLMFFVFLGVTKTRSYRIELLYESIFSLKRKKISTFLRRIFFALDLALGL